MYVSAVESNVEAMCRKLDLVAYLYPWVQMVLFSELAPFGPVLHNAQPLPGPVEDRFRAAAERHGLWLLPGTLFERRGERIYNTAPVIAPDGTVVARYSKMFPFLPYEEGVEAGDQFVLFDVPGAGRFGVSICYDMWFPETTRTLAARGAEVILHPSLTSTIDRGIELSIAVASAAVNQCFVFDINGLGAGGTGRSIVVGPAGDVQHQAGGAEEIIPIEIDLDRVRRSREVGLRGLGQPLKSFRDRKVDFDVYATPGGGDFLRGLGPLEKAARGSRAGLDRLPVGDPAAAPVAAPPDDPYPSRIPGAEIPTGVSLPLADALIDDREDR
jgi:deaminated glutathione amidase